MKVLITGAATGIGRSCARLFAGKGYDVVINYNKSQEDAILLQKQLSSVFGNKYTIYQADITDSHQVEERVWLVMTRMVISMFL